MLKTLSAHEPVTTPSSRSAAQEEEMMNRANKEGEKVEIAFFELSATERAKRLPRMLKGHLAIESRRTRGLRRRANGNATPRGKRTTV
jgi:hypothetical protein